MEPRRRGRSAAEMFTRRYSRVAARLADLSHAQLLEIAVHGCERSPEVKEAAAVLAQAEAIGKPAPYDECCA